MTNFFKDKDAKYLAKLTTCVRMLLLICAVWFIVFPAAEAEGKIEMAQRNAEYYSLTACVVKIDRESDTVMVEDSTGNRWQFYGVEDWQEGDCASLLMWDNGTDLIFDDEVHSARYNAWTLTH